MATIATALARARKTVKKMESENNSGANQCIVCAEWNEPLNGELVVILHPEGLVNHEDHASDIIREVG